MCVCVYVCVCVCQITAGGVRGEGQSESSTMQTCPGPGEFGVVQILSVTDLVQNVLIPNVMA